MRDANRSYAGHRQRGGNQPAGCAVGTVAANPHAVEWLAESGEARLLPNLRGEEIPVKEAVSMREQSAATDGMRWAMTRNGWSRKAAVEDAVAIKAYNGATAHWCSWRGPSVHEWQFNYGPSSAVMRDTFLVLRFWDRP